MIEDRKGARMRALVVSSLLASWGLFACDEDRRDYYRVHGRDAAYAWRDAALDASRGEGGMVPFSDVFGVDGSVRWIDGSLYLRDGGAFPWMLPDGATVLEDGAVVLPDGQVLDVEQAIRRYAEAFLEPDVGACGVSEDDVFVRPDVGFVDSGAFDIVPGATGFGVAHRDEVCGKADAVFTGRVGATGEIAAPEIVLDACKQVEFVELAWTEDARRLVWTDNATGSLELHVQALDEALVPMGEAVALTDNDRREEAPVFAEVAGRPMLAWVERGSGGRRIVTRMVDASGAETIEVVPETAMHAPVTLALAQMGPDAAAVAWVEEVAQRGMWLQRLDAEGGPVGTPVQLTPFAGGGSTIDLASYDEGGAAVYSVVIDASAGDPTIDGGHEVRFQRLDVTGASRGSEIKVVSGPEQGVGASVARVAGGYAIAYRSRPTGPSEPEIRLVFVTKEGNVFRDPQGRLITYPLAPAGDGGSQTKIEFSVDGYLLIGHVDGQGAEGNAWTLIRRRLDCR
jgi:hypothetical protein